MSKNKFITNSSNGLENITSRNAFKITSIDSSKPSFCSITLDENINQNIPEGNYIISIKASHSYFGVNCSITRDNNVLTITTSKINPFPDLTMSNETTGSIHNILIFDDYPDWGNIELNYFNFASGSNNQSIGESSICSGYENKTGTYCGAFGQGNKVLGESSFAFGEANILNNTDSAFAAGTSNVIYGSNNAAFGFGNLVEEKAYRSFCIGSNNIISGHHSFTCGEGLVAKGAYTTLFGKYATINNNLTEGQGKIAFAIGNGSAYDNTSNAFAVDWNGGTVSGQNNIGYSYGWKISEVGLCDENHPLPSDAEKGVNYGYYTLNSNIETFDIEKEKLVGQKYCVVINTNQTYPGAWDNTTRKWIYGTIVKIDGFDVYVSYIPMKDDETVLGKNTADEDDPAKGDINNYLLIPDYPELGDTLIGYFTHAEGQNNVAMSRVAHTEGRDNKVVGKYGHAEGRQNSVGYCGHGEGYNNLVIGDNSHAEGSRNIVESGTSHAEGAGNYVSGAYSHAENINNNATGRASHVQGENNNAAGHASHAGGNISSAYGAASLAQGTNLRAWGKNTVVFGRYNDCAKDYNTNEDEYGRFGLVFGNGTSEKRSNALTLDWSGNLEVQSSVKAPCAILVSPDGTEFKLKVANDGTLITERMV